MSAKTLELFVRFREADAEGKLHAILTTFVDFSKPLPFILLLETLCESNQVAYIKVLEHGEEVRRYDLGLRMPKYLYKVKDPGYHQA